MTAAGFTTMSAAPYDAAGNLTTPPGLSNISYTAADQLKSGTVYTYKYAYGRPSARPHDRVRHERRSDH